MPDLVTGDNLLAFDIVDQPAPDDDGTGPDFHLVVYQPEDDNPSDPIRWKPCSWLNADQLAGALSARGLLTPEQTK